MNTNKVYFNEKLLYKEYDQVILDNGGKTLSQDELNEMGRYDIAIAFSRLGIPKKKVEEDLGYTPCRDRTKGTSFYSKQKVKDVISNLYAELGKGKPINFHSKKAKEHYKKENLSIYLLGASIKKWFGSKRELDIALGFNPLLKHWEDETEVIKEYAKECRKHGNVALSELFLKKIGRSDINNAIGRKFSIDKNELDISLGFKPLKRYKPWTKEEVTSKFQEVCDEHNGGQPLSGNRLKDLGHSNLTTQIHNHFSSKFELYELLGMDSLYEDRRDWSFDDYLNDYRATCEDQGGLPVGQRDLQLFRKTHLNKWIGRMIKQGVFQSRNTLNEMCGYVTAQSYRLSNGAYVRSSFEVKFGNFLIHNNISFTVDAVIDENSRKKYRYDFLVTGINGNDVYIEIWGYSNNRNYTGNYMDRLKKNYERKKNNKKAFYKRRGLKLINIDASHFLSLSLNDLQEFFQKILIENHIKLNDFKILNSAGLLRADSESAWTKEKVFAAYSKLCSENGGRPISIPDLKTRGSGGLALAIHRYYPGGKTQLDKDAGYRPMKGPTFTLEQIKEKLKNLVEENGGIPLFAKELENMGHRLMCRSISHYYNTDFVQIYTDIGYGDKYVSMMSSAKSSYRVNKCKNFLKENGSAILESYEKHGRNKAAELWGVHSSCMGHWIKKLGGVFKNRNLRENKSQVLKDHQELGAKPTAQKYNVHPSTIHRFVKKHKKPFNCYENK
jgi:hypothetical protein